MTTIVLREVEDAGMFAEYDGPEGHCYFELQVTVTTPLTNIPLLVEDPSETIPQEALDALMELRIHEQAERDGDKNLVWWFDYFRSRRNEWNSQRETLTENDQKFREGGPHAWKGIALI